MKNSNRDTPKKSHQHLRDAASRCLDTMQNGTIDELFALLPHISVLRDERFYEPLVALLQHKSARKREFAALGLGALKNPLALEPLFQCVIQSFQAKNRRLGTLRVPIIHAMGEIGSDRATPYIRKLLPGGDKALETHAEHSRLVEALGLIAQQGGKAALEILLGLASGPNTDLCIHAIPEIAVAFWHRPQRLPKRILRLLQDRLLDEVAEVRAAAAGALENLAHLGCQTAEQALNNARV